MTYTTDQLKQVLELHAAWLGNRAGGERADLRDANLSGADLRDANLSGANLPVGFKVARLDFGGWSIYVTPTHTIIGCQSHPNKDWLKWDPKDVASFDSGASEWWKQHGAAVKTVIKDVQS